MPRPRLLQDLREVKVILEGELDDRLDAYCKERNLSRSHVIRSLLAAFFGLPQPESPPKKVKPTIEENLKTFERTVNLLIGELGYVQLWNIVSESDVVRPDIEYPGLVVNTKLMTTTASVWNSKTSMPDDLCDKLRLPRGSTYGRGAQTLRRKLDELKPGRVP